MKKCGIYKITSPTGKIYIGQSIDIDLRFRRYAGGYVKSQRKLFHSLKKHGWENHLKEVLEICTEIELNSKEIYYSELFDSTNPNTGLNIRKCGGSRGSLSNETKILIGLSNKGRVPSIECRKKISNTLLGNTPWNKGVKGVTTAWNKGIPCEENLKVKLRSLYLGVTGQQAYASKKIRQFNLSGEEIKEWYGAREIERELGFKCSVINRASRGERATAYGYKWKYE